MKLKPGVDDSQTDPVLGLWIGVLARHHRDWTGSEFVVTSLRRKSSDWSTLHVVKSHELVRAVDFRRWHLDEHDAADPFCRMLVRHYEKWLKIILEPEWLSAEAIERRGGVLNIDPHVHVELSSNEWPAGIL